MRKCSKCGIKNNGRNFYKDKKSRDGLTTRCMDCTYRKAIPKYISVNGKACRDCKLDKKSDQFPVNKAMSDGLGSYCKDCSVIRSIASRFKLSKDDYFSMLSRGCDSCGSFSRLCIDHDYSCCSGQMTCGRCIRGVLCGSCNTIEGHTKTKEQLLGLIQYMEKNNAFK